MKKLELSKFNFLSDYLLVKAIETTKATKGLVRPDQYEDKPEFGEVIQAGPGRVLESGELIPMSVKPGDTVFFGKYSTEKTRHLGEDYYIIRSDDIMAKAK